MQLEINKIRNGLFSSYQFTEEDHQTLRSYDAVIDGIPLLFGKQCEVMLLSLENIECSTIKICRGFNTGLIEDTIINESALNVLQDLSTQHKQCSKVFFTQTKNGQMIRSMIVAIKNRVNRTIGLIYININLNSFFINFAQELLPSFEELKSVSPVNFATTVKELIASSVKDTIVAINNRTDISNNVKNKYIIISLYQQGIFDIKNAINLVADNLNISIHTVYSYIRQIKSDKATL